MDTLEKWHQVCVSGHSPIGDWLGRSIDRRIIREQKTFELSPLSSAFEDTLEKDEQQKALLRAVDRLPDEQKEVLTLKIWGELTFDEIARTLDASLNTVASRYRYALQKLKDWVPEELEKPNPNLSPWTNLNPLKKSSSLLPHSPSSQNQGRKRLGGCR